MLPPSYGERYSLPEPYFTYRWGSQGGSLAKYLRFYLYSPIKEMLHFQCDPLHVSWSHQYRSLPSKFPSQRLSKEGCFFSNPS